MQHHLHPGLPAQVKGREMFGCEIARRVPLHTLLHRLVRRQDDVPYRTNDVVVRMGKVLQQRFGGLAHRSVRTSMRDAFAGT